MIDLNKIQMGLEVLKQPSTIKGLLGLAMLAGWQIAPEEYQTLINGLGVLYCLIAIFWQKS